MGNNTFLATGGNFRHEQGVFINNEITGKYPSPSGGPGGGKKSF